MPNSNFETDYVNGSVPTAADSTELQSTKQVKLYEVAITADVQLTLSGCVGVYATDPDEAVEKVQVQIDDEALGDDIELEDDWSGVTVRYGHLKYCSDIDFQIESVEVVESNVDPVDVLNAEVKDLEAQVTWNTTSLAKRKAFLESLLNAGDDQQAVAA
jgi:hypothetical protein